MAMTLEELQGYRDALVRAVARGEKSVKYDGREVVFRDISEIRSALAVIDGEIGGLGDGVPTSPFIVVATDMD